MKSMALSAYSQVHTPAAVEGVKAAGARSAMAKHQGNGVDQFRDTNTEVILEPAEYRTGTVIAPYNGGAGDAARYARCP